jgi:hypothetical protein
MPSIMLNWYGQCPDSRVRQKIIRRMTEIARISFEKFEERYDRYDHEITGKIVLHDGVFDDRRVPPRLVPHPTNAHLYCLEKARLFGIEFRLPTIYGGRMDDNRVTFVFLCADDDPELDGFLVRVHDRAQCQDFRDPEIQAADWLLTAPHIHLRYAFEDWVTDLLAWVRVAYMPDLRYSDFEHLDPDSRYLYGCSDHSLEVYFKRLKRMNTYI